MKTCPRVRQRGASLILAVFVLTVMLLLGSVLVRTLNQEIMDVGLETTSTRAWAAAQSGIDWGLARTLNRGAEDGDEACEEAADAANLGVLLPGNGLPELAAFNGCRVAVDCTYRAAHGSDSVEHAFELTASASCGAEPIRVTRTMEALAYD